MSIERMILVTAPICLSVSLEQVILKAMSYDVNKRYKWVEDLWEDLDKAER